jgi:molybdate transport system substrate-binding protein
LILLPVAAAGEDYVTVAVASNFGATARAIAARFERDTNYEIRITTASTGKLYAQIVNGAPFDLLLAADAERPHRLEAAGVGVVGTRFTYARGMLILWSRTAGDCRSALRSEHGGRVAIANPETAPYGAAARSFMQQAGLWGAVRGRARPAGDRREHCAGIAVRGVGKRGTRFHRAFAVAGPVVAASVMQLAGAGVDA